MTEPTITFYNEGYLDMRAVTTFGLSVKKTTNPIGYFGTGLKYAIAILLREGCSIEIQVADSTYTFSIEVSYFREEVCELIYMTKGESQTQLPFTKELGKNWELWQAYRELYCNAVDEGGDVCTEASEAPTQIRVTGEAFQKVHEEREEFLNFETPLYSTELVDIVPTAGVYLKGVKISSNIYYPTKFGYNFHGGLRLTEDRTLESTNLAEDIIEEALNKINNYDLTKAVLLSDEGTFENQISWSYPIEPIGENFKKAFLDCNRNHPEKVSGSAVKLAVKMMDKGDVETSYTLSPVQEVTMQRARTFLYKQGIDLDDYPLKFVKTLGNNVWGSAVNGTITISTEVFQYGLKCLVATLYEEHLHLSRDFRDLTREMQNHLFHTIVSLWEEQSGTSL